MASINGVQLKKVQSFEGQEGYGFSANIYLDNKKIGTVLDNACGGDFTYYIDDEAELLNRIDSYFKVYPQYDFSIYKMNIEEFVEKRNKGTLPIRKVNASLEMDVFFSKLLNLLDKEKSFKKSVKKGYGKLYCISFTTIKNTPRPYDVMYYIRDDSLDRILEKEKKKQGTAEGHLYSSLDDFIIETR